MKTKIIVILCLLAGLVVFVFLAGKYHWLAKSRNPVAEVKNLIPKAPSQVYPDTFPKELVFDMSPVDSVANGTSSSGKAQVTVKYVSVNPIGDFARAVKEILTAKKWVITTGKDDPSPREIVASRDAEQVTVRLSPDAAAGTTAVTVLYEK